MRHRSTVMTVLALGLVLVAGCATASRTGPLGTATSTSVSTTSSAGPSMTSVRSSPSGTSSTAPAPTTSTLPVYYLGESQKSVKLFREFRAVPNIGGTVASAVRAMTRVAPLDPDYLTPWRPARRVSVARTGGNILVDLSMDAFANTGVGSAVAAMAVQQLVYTATAAAAAIGTPATSVTLTVNGQATDAWGVIHIGSAMTRAPVGDVQARAWIIAPQQDEIRPAGTVTFSGYGTSFEATFGWVIRTTAGAKVAQGSAMGGTGTGGFGPLAFHARLGAGTYIVTLSTDDPSNGASGLGPAIDTKAFTVR